MWKSSRVFCTLVLQFPARPSCAEGPARKPRIRPREQALKHPYIEVNPPHEDRFLLFQVEESAPVPVEPSAGVFDPGGGPFHALYGPARKPSLPT